MFRHQGKKRTYIHNLRLASVLSFIAGIVNISGLLFTGFLTTNVTGHFAYFSKSLVNENLSDAAIFLLFLLGFLLGAFFSNLIGEVLARKKAELSYAVPILLETLLLLWIAFSGADNFGRHTVLFAFLLLFCMGLQNALVTSVSRSVVRTTHLTGLFTDLGIELSQLFFYKESTETLQLKKSIYLKLAIITSFFFGGILGGFVFHYVQLDTLFLACFCLIVALFYDYLRIKFYFFKRKISIRKLMN